ncbi:MAG TPA: TlpA disulfide reductase family protein [Actinomycetota bacterium]|nr:TlpA disulfide reductase family protein [Actinomycetota bacterium]
MTASEETEQHEQIERPWHRRLSVIVPALILVALVVYGALTRVEPKVALGGGAPEFELPLLDGSGTLSSDDLEGSPVVVNFFASWCFPCREEAPELERLSREYADEGVTFIGVNVQGGLPPMLLDSAEGARDFVDEYGISYPVVADPDGELAKDLMDFYGLPQTFFVDHEWEFAGGASGRQVDEREGAVVLGAISEEKLRREIDAMLEEMRAE